MHYTRILIGIGGVLMGGSLFFDPLDPSTGTRLHEWFGESGTALLFPFGTGIDAWMLFALLGSAAALVAVAVIKGHASVLDRRTAIVALALALVGTALAALVYGEIGEIASFFGFGIGVAAYGIVAGGAIAVVGAALQFRKQPPAPIG